MRADSPAQVREIGSVRPRARSNLRFIFQEFGGERSCVIEDPLTSKFHRVGLAEYRFIRRLDGDATFAEAFARSSLESGADALTEREAVGVLSWLVEQRLADVGGEIPEETLRRSRDRKIGASLKNAFNLLFVKIPLGRPEAFLNRVYPFSGFLCGRLFFLVWLLFGIVGVGQVAVNWDRFVRGTEGVLAPHNWLWLLVVWTGLKVWHEFWHALVCKHHGGRVREAGVLLVLLTPLGYVDASSSLAFPSKWKRMHVAAAGIYGEFFLAAIAAIIWARTDPGVVNTIAMNTMVMASTVTLLFNLNPLMRFDGYFLLIDLIEKPNLYTRANRLVKALARRWLLGTKEAPTPWREGDTWLCLAYGVSSLVWRVLIIVTLLAAAALLLKGGGLVFALVGLAFWLYPILKGFFTSLTDRRGGREPVNFWSAGLRCGLVAAALATLLLFPFRLAVTAPGVVRHEGEAILRAEGPGFVHEVLTRDDAPTEAGALLVRLANPALENQLAALATSHRRQDYKRRIALLERSAAEYEAEVALLDALRSQYLQQLQFVETLDIVAPRAGRVVAPGLSDRTGRYLRTGDEILRVVDPDAIEILVPVSQDDVDAFRRQVGQPVSIFVEGRLAIIEGRLHRIGGRAGTEIEHEALTSLAGGPLPVKQRDSTLNDPARPAGGHELARPYFWGEIRLPSTGGPALRPGERVRVKFTGEEAGGLGKRAFSRVQDFMDHVFASTASL